jgi:hypothetical protein
MTALCLLFFPIAFQAGVTFQNASTFAQRDGVHAPPDVNEQLGVGGRLNEYIMNV